MLVTVARLTEIWTARSVVLQRAWASCRQESKTVLHKNIAKQVEGQSEQYTLL